jgi:uncharacterized protein YcbX
MTGEVRTLFERPLTGARARHVSEVALCAGGIIGNRLFVPYDVSDPENYRRISQKEIRELAQLHAHIDRAGNVRIAHERTDLDLGGLKINANNEPDIHINEFGDLTPALDAGYQAAQSLQDFTGWENIRLAQKTLAWHYGEGIAPEDRKNAPLYIVSSPTLERINELLIKNGKLPVDVDRLRPDIFLEVEDDAFEEQHWEALVIGGLVIKPLRMAEHCGGIGDDQDTGQKMVDVPLIYKEVPQSQNGKAEIGVYARVDIEPGEEVRLQKGAKVEIIKSS